MKLIQNVYILQTIPNIIHPGVCKYVWSEVLIHCLTTTISCLARDVLPNAVLTPQRKDRPRGRACRANIEVEKHLWLVVHLRCYTIATFHLNTSITASAVYFKSSGQLLSLVYNFMNVTSQGCIYTVVVFIPISDYCELQFLSIVLINFRDVMNCLWQL